MASATLPDYTILNIGHPEVVPIEELADRICEATGAPSRLIRLVDQPEGMTLVKRPNLDRMRRRLGSEPTISVDEGVQRVVDTTARRLAGTSHAPG